MPEEINNQQNIQIARLEEKFDGFEKGCNENFKRIEGKVDLISANCIPTLTKEVAKVDAVCVKLDANQKTIMWFLGVVVVTMLAILGRLFYGG